MNERTKLTIVLGICAVLLLVGLVFSVRLTAGINAEAQRESTQHAPVPTPTPPALAPSKPAPAHG